MTPRSPSSDDADATGRAREGEDADATARTPGGDDADLVARACAGEERAREELVGRHLDSVFRVALAILRDESRAEDAAQETFLKAFRSLESFRGDAPYRSWLLAIASNEARTMLRRAGRRRETSLDEAPPQRSANPGPHGRLEEAEEMAWVRSCLERLPEKQRLAVELRVFDGLSFRDVGRAIGSSEGAARVNYHHGIRRLRELLE